MNKPTIAIGCIVQWYEVEMFTEYLASVINSINYYFQWIIKVIYTLFMEKRKL